MDTIAKYRQVGGAYDAGWYSLVEAEHEIQNPVSADAIRLLGKHLGLGRRSRVLDVASGTCGPALILAREYGSRFTCVDSTTRFVDVARGRIELAGMEPWFELVEEDAAAFDLTRRWHAALCLGASFVYGGFVPTLRTLSQAAPLVAVGEPYTKLSETIRSAEDADVDVVSVLVSTDEDWDVYETQRMRTLERWLADSLDLSAQEKNELRCRERGAQQRRRDEERGWAIFVCRA